MHVNPDNVEKLADSKYDENYDLRLYFKMQQRLSEEQVDQLVADITRAVWADVDCTTCGNCCKDLQPSVTDAEIEKLAAGLDISVETFREQYIEGPAGPEDYDDDDDCDVESPQVTRWRMRGNPCPFLKDNRCSVYDDRPEQCRKYPYLYEPEFSYRTLGMIGRTFTCPIVYEVFERLKAEVPWRQRRKRW